MDRFLGAVGTDLPTEDLQTRYRLPLGNHEGSLKEGPEMEGVGCEGE